MVNTMTNNIPTETYITLTGCSKFKNMFEYMNRLLSLQGKVVYSYSIYEYSDSIELTAQERTILHEVQRVKIMKSQCLFVIDVDGYIDEITKSDIIFAEILKIKIYYLSKYLNTDEV